MKKNVQILLVSSVLILFSCKKKEKTSWDSDWSAPIAHGHLTIGDMIPVDYIETNDDGYLSIVVNESVLTFSLDTLLDLPDTTISQRLSTGLPSATFEPDDEILYEYDQQYTLGGIELKAVGFKEGFAKIDVLSPWGGKLEVDFSLPNTSKGGVVLNRLYYLDAGTEENQANGVDNIDLSGYTMQMTGMDLDQYNTFTGKMIIGSNEETESFTVTNMDSITFDFSFSDLVAEYARGYFGQYSFSDTTGLSLGFMDQVVAGAIELDSIRLDLSIRNGFNLVAQSKITKLTGINSKSGSQVELDFPLKNNTLNVNRADGGLYDFVPSEYPIPVNNTNSNVLAFLENLSDSILVGYDLQVNPFGNVTGGDDEFFPGSKMELFLNGEFPLNFGANNLTIEDTVDIDWNLPADEITPNKGTVYLEYDNGFPIGAIGKFYLLDEDNTVIDSIVGNTGIASGNLNPSTFVTTASKGVVVFSIPESKFDSLDKTERLIVSVSFTTESGEKVKINPDTYFDFKLKTDLQIKTTF